MRFILSILASLILTVSFNAQSGAKDGQSIYNQDFNFVPVISLNNDFNAQDWYTGASVGIEDKGYQWGARVGFQFRPFDKKVQVFNDNLTRQYVERKYFTFVDLDKRMGHLSLMEQHLQFYFGLRSGFLFGNYRGTRNDAPAYFVAAPFAGLCFNINDQTFFKLGYNHFSDRLLNVDDGRVNFSFIITIL